MHDGTLIRLCDVSRRDAKTNRWILKQIDLEIDATERVGVVGATGSGKSSLLRAVALLDRLTSGQVLYGGEAVSHDAVPKYRRKVIYLPQRPAFVPGTVRDNLERPFQIVGSDGQALDTDVAVRVLDDLDRPADLLEQSVESLSGGEQQFVAMIRAIVLQPQVILFDEPTASLDLESAGRFENVVRRWQSEQDQGHGRSYVWTSHDPQQIQRMTDRIVQVSDGTLSRETTSNGGSDE